MILPITLTIISAALTVIADMCLRQCKGRRQLAASMGLYVLIALMSVSVFKYMQFGIYYVLWEVFTTAIAILVGTLHYKETLTPMRLLAAVMTFAAIVELLRS